MASTSLDQDIIVKIGYRYVIQFLKFSHWTFSSHDTWSIAMLDGYSNGLEEKGFGTPFTNDIADFVPEIFEELDRNSMKGKTRYTFFYLSVKMCF